MNRRGFLGLIASAAVGLSIGMQLSLPSVRLKFRQPGLSTNAYYDNLIRHHFMPIIADARESEARWIDILAQREPKPVDGKFIVRLVSGGRRNGNVCHGFPGNYGDQPPRYPE